MRLTWTKHRDYKKETFYVADLGSLSFSIYDQNGPLGRCFTACVQQGGGAEQRLGTFGGGKWEDALKRARDACIEFVRKCEVLR